MVKDQTVEKTRYWAKRFECPIDEDAGYHNTFWCNRDLIPVPPDRRTWTWQGYAGYWVIAGINTSAWTAGSSLISLGLSVPQSMDVVVGVSLLVALISVIAGWPGSHQYLGFTVLCRASWGMRGAFWPVLNRIMTAIIWLGIHMYWGGQAINIILGAIIGRVFMKNTLPESAAVDTASLVCFFVFIVIFLPTLMVPPEKLQMPFRVTFVMITCTMFGILGWAVNAAVGPGKLINTGSSKHGAVLSWGSVYGLQSILGSQASGCLGQSDWTRYAKTPNAALFGQLVTAPITICVTAICGILITSASATIYDTYLWNPFELLLHMQQKSLTPACRAGTFFAGLGFLSSQLALCIVLNCISAGMDLAALCPKWINIRCGSYFLTVIGVAICPWQYLTKPSTFITVLSGWSYRLGDFYTGNSTSAYWYTLGFNWRGLLSWTMGLWPVLPGFARAIRGTASETGWDRLYDITYFYGSFVAVLVYWISYVVFPVPKQTGASPFVLADHVRMLEVKERGSESPQPIHVAPAKFEMSI
ncbi:NCS1 nucleoside transporter family protein [Teratosphaeria nubilosa]|uniref:NCS1 nucleoside transporter family protein n=1 Tax=Teratosphaeria nubilosa TaxID=161662 RepID=A0A6G1LAW6_9PEZI|nr:NCS1 nucleoside transporter family protein [Teratosphaeria nubilosa]